MNTLRNPLSWLSLAFALVFLASCSSVGDLPSDDVYYSKKSKNPSEYNWDDFQKSAQSYNDGKNSTNSNSGTLTEGEVYGGSLASEDISTTVEGEDFDYVDGYYEDSYEERLNRFGSNSESSGFDYYDGYNSNSGCNCGGGSNWSVGFGMSMGMGYGYGYPSYGYGYPSYGYGYPYYGSSYAAGYAAGYNNGYWNAYYGYPYYGYPIYGYGTGGYGGGYVGYPDYYASTGYYGHRGSGTTGTTIPVSSGAPRDEDGMKRGDGTYVSGTGGAGTVGGRSGNVIASQSGGTSERLTKPVDQNDISTTIVQGNRSTVANKGVQSTPQDKLQKPASTNQNVVSGRKYEKPVNSGTSRTMPEPKYDKPASYKSLPSQRPRSSQEYVKPTTRSPMTKSMTTTTSPYQRTRKPSTSSSGSSISNTRSSGSSNYSSPSSSGSSSPTRSYSSPTRSSSSGSSFSSPSRSSSSGSSTRSMSSSGSRSSGSSTRSSGSSTRSSGSSSSIKR